VYVYVDELRERNFVPHCGVRLSGEESSAFYDTVFVKLARNWSVIMWVNVRVGHEWTCE
jgi:hypothetical protein